MNRIVRLRHWLIATIAIAALAVALLPAVFGQVPNTFTSGTAISSASINANFTYLYTQITALQTQVVPPGAIVPFGGTTAPTGWLLCNGSQQLVATYPNLAAALSNGSGGYVWGSSGAGAFYLPDLRGRFPRGVDGGAGNDPDTVSRTAANTGGNTGDNVGSLQADQFASHTHSLTFGYPGGLNMAAGPNYDNISSVGAPPVLLAATKPARRMSTSTSSSSIEARRIFTCQKF